MNRAVNTQPITGARALIAAARPIGPDGGLIARAIVFQAYAVREQAAQPTWSGRSPPSEFELAGVLGVLVESWSFEARPSADAEGIRSVPAADDELLWAAVIAELSDLQRAVRPSPGWCRR
jgi:hypothetical protein